MSMRYPGGLIAGSPVNANYPSGVWTQAQTAPYAAQNVWQRDQYWRNTTLLLHGDGTNGAQNNTFLDSSSNNFTITRNGNTTQGAFTPYQQNGYWSNYFDGTGDWLSVTNTGNYATAFGTGDFTIEFWIYPDGAFGSFANIYDARGTDDNAVLIRVTSGSLTYYSFGADHITATAPSVNTWHHIALSRVSGSSKLFVDGVQVGSTYTDTLNYGNESVIAIGGRNNDGANAYKGYISNVRVLNGTGLYTTTFVPSATALTAITNTKLLTCQANRFIDSGPNALAITRNGDTSVQAFQPFPGATTWSASVLGGSGYFDGTGDYLTTSTNAAFPMTGDFTIEAWVYVSAPAVASVIVEQRQGTGAGSGYWQLSYSSALALTFTYDGDANFITAGTLTANAWNHVAATRTSSTISLYLNGARQGQATSSATVGRNDALWIGAQQSGGPKYYAIGYLSDIRIIDGTNAYGSGTTLTVPTAPLTAITNTSLLLSCTNAGIYDNAQMNDLETVGNTQVSTSVVKYNTGSMYFDGSGDYLVAKDNTLLRLSGEDFTVEGWVYLTGNQPQFDGGVASYGATTSTVGWAISITGSSAGGTLNRLVYGVNASASGGAPLYGVNGIPLNTWTHIAVTKNGSTVRFFINGALDTSGTVTATPTVSSSYLFYVGTQAYDPTATTRQFAGYIDDLRITKGVARYTTTFTPPVARMPNQ